MRCFAPILFAAAVSIAAPAAAQRDCDTTFSPTDGFDRLTEALTCLEERIEALEELAGVGDDGGGSASVLAVFTGPNTFTLLTGGAGNEWRGSCAARGATITCETVFTPATDSDGNWRIDQEDFSAVFADGSEDTRANMLSIGGRATGYQDNRRYYEGVGVPIVFSLEAQSTVQSGDTLPILRIFDSVVRNLRLN